MDVVKITVERLQGAVNVDSRLGKGTSIVLDLPVSLALLRALLVEVRGELFAVPTGALDRILYVRPDQIRVLQDGQVLDVGGESIPLVSMGALLQLPPPVNPSPLQAVVVGRAFTRRFGMMVDAIHEEQEFVFKELRGRLRNQRLFSGVSILGSGQLVLIVEVNEVFQMATRAPAVSAPVAAEVKREVVPASILVVEDSYITGELERGILHAAGYGAEIAQDGIAALEALQKKKYDLVVADVDMPRMDGFELTSRIRGDERLRDIPVIIVTARESHADRRRGIEVGADAYIMKREFDQSHLLETVQRLIGR
jgi:two-component system chemotaxis sensor kinase CheA